MAMPQRNAPMKNHQPKSVLVQPGVSDITKSQASSVKLIA